MRLLVPLAAATLATWLQSAPTVERWTPTYNVYAIRYATLPAFPVASLVEGAHPGRRLDLAMMVWLLESSDGRAVLFDAGFYREKFLEQWQPRDFVRPSDAVARMGIPPDRIWDVIVSHVHWDHLDGADLFPSATVWMQRAEYEYYTTGDGRQDGVLDPVDAAMLARIASDDRLGLVDGDGREIIPGITAYIGGRHTHASQYIRVQTSRGAVVLASDNVYLYENLERGAPIAQTVDAAANRQAQARMRQLASSPRFIVPGHDPAVFARFPLVFPGIAAIPR